MPHGRTETPTASPPGHGCTRRRFPPRTFPLLVALAAASASLAGPSATAANTGLEAPTTSDIAVANGPIRDALVRDLAARLASTPTYWGGRYTAYTGESVTIYTSDSYPRDDVTAQRWADYLASLVHGSELPRLTTYMVTPSEVRELCGPGALACYSNRDSRLVVPGQDGVDVSVEALLAHEYGHHLASFRRNDPWAAVEWGTKRWATYENVCVRTRARELFPGAENASEYTRNPGEAFAETYRVLNERRAGVAEAPWSIVDRTLYPDDQALALVTQDVLSPWNGNRTTTFRGSVSSSATSRSFTLATPLDGSIRASVRPPRNGALRLEVLSPAGKRVGVDSVRAPATATVVAQVCGTRSYRLRVTRVSGAGRFALRVAVP